MFKIFAILAFSFLLFSCAETPKTETAEEAPVNTDTLKFAEEVHFKNLRQLTFGGDNAEAYWDFGSSQLVFQSNYKGWNVSCDQIFVMNAVGEATNPVPMVSTGKGRTTCSYFMPGDSTVLYASTHLESADCPADPPRVEGGPYLWPIYSSFEIFVADLKGNIVKQLTNRKGYDAEATVSPKGDKIVFTSDRTGDLELYVMNIDGTNVKQITNLPGYDGGAFFSPDGTKIVFRASRPQVGEELDTYNKYLKQGLVAPTKMEIFTCNVDGSDMKQITNLGKANWAPYFTPKGDKIIFSSNHSSSRGYQFNLYTINLDGTGLKQISFDKTFDSFPMFSPDGKYISFSSNRNNNGTRDTNVFVAEWVD